MEKKKKAVIMVETLPNGYSLKVDQESYMYFDARKLLAGMFYHVGLEKLDYIDTDHVELLMEAILTWPDIKGAVKGQAIQMRELKDARESLYKSRKQCGDLEKKLHELREQYRECNIKLITAQKRLDTDNQLQLRLGNALDDIQNKNTQISKLVKEKGEKTQMITALKRELAKYKNNDSTK